MRTAPSRAKGNCPAADESRRLRGQTEQLVTHIAHPKSAVVHHGGQIAATRRRANCWATSCLHQTAPRVGGGWSPLELTRWKAGTGGHKAHTSARVTNTDAMRPVHARVQQPHLTSMLESVRLVSMAEAVEHGPVKARATRVHHPKMWSRVACESATKRGRLGLSVVVAEKGLESGPRGVSAQHCRVRIETAPNRRRVGEWLVHIAGFGSFISPAGLMETWIDCIGATRRADFITTWRAYADESVATTHIDRRQ